MVILWPMAGYLECSISLQRRAADLLTTCPMTVCIPDTLEPHVLHASECDTKYRSHYEVYL